MKSNKNLQDARTANQKSQQNATMSNTTNTTAANDAALQEARTLNQQSQNSGSGNLTSSTWENDLQQAKQANQKSAQNKK